jgi:integrase
MLSAMTGTRIKDGYLVNPMLAQVHWQAGDRPVPALKVTVAGESALLVDPAEIPSAGDVGTLGRAPAARSLGEIDELMANLAAYSGLRWGELIALTAGQVALAARVITVDRKVVEVGGRQYEEALVVHELQPPH